jgi:hypothetical protein
LQRVTGTLSAIAASGGFEPDEPGALSADREPPGFDAFVPAISAPGPRHAVPAARAGRPDASDRARLATARSEERARKQAEAKAREAERHRLRTALRDAEAEVRERERELSRRQKELRAAEEAVEDARKVLRAVERELAALDDG